MQGPGAILWGAINIVLIIAFRVIGPRYFKERAGTAMAGMAILMIANGVLALFIAPPYMGKNTAYVASVSDGKTLFVVHQVGGRSHTYVLEPWDLASGVRLARKVPSIFAWDPYAIVMQVDNRVFLTSGVDGLHARDLRTGEVVLSQSDLAMRSPLLAAPIHDASGAGDSICFSRDGYPVRLDVRTLQATQLAAGERCLDRAEDDRRDAIDLMPLGERRQVTRPDRKSREQPLDPGHSYLGAEWVEVNHRALRLDDDPPSQVMTYLADGTHAPMLARIAIADGRTVWTHPLADSSIERGMVTGGTLVVITRSTISALDAKTGVERWSKSY